MEVSPSEILDPVYILIALLFLPKVAYSCAVFAYDGLKNGETLTHFGMRKGTIARIYGIFYFLGFIFSATMIPFLVEIVLDTDRAIMGQALLFSISIPLLGFVFIGMAILMVLFREGLVKFSKTIKADNDSANKIFYSNVLLALAVGIQTLLGLPYWILVGIFAFFIYFSPMASPKELKVAYRLPSDKM